MRTQKAFSAASILVLIASLLLVIPVYVQGQQQYTNIQEGGSITLPMGVIPTYTVDTEARLSFRPNPVGVGQSVLINAWTVPPLHASRYFSNFTIVVTRPDGTQQIFTKKSYRGDATTWVEFTPNTPGVWKIKFEFPGGYFPPGNYTIYPGAFVGPQVVNFRDSVYYKPSSDGPYELIVQDTPVESWPPSPLPKDYWTRPVSPDNREWWSILGWYPSTGIVGKDDSYWPDNTNKYAQSLYRYVPYVQAPDSPHIVWKRPGAIGGLIGGPLEQISFEGGGGGPSIIYAGRCYQTLTKVVDGKPTSVWQCYDLRTGEIFWERTEVTLVPTTVFIRREPRAAVPGAEAYAGNLLVDLMYIGGGRIICYNPLTGDVRLNVSISPLTTGTYYSTGSYPDLTSLFLTVRDLGPAAAPDRYRLINWTLEGTHIGAGYAYNYSVKIFNNVSWPFSSLGVVDFETGVAVSTLSITNPGTGTGIDAYIMAADLHTGQILWNNTAGVSYYVWPSETIADHGKVAIRFGDGYIYCWDLRSGRRLWKSEITSWPWATFGAYGISSYGGMIIVGQYDGIAAYDWDSGKVAWLYQYKAPYPYETPYQDNYPFFSGSPLIADGKVYMPNSEHTASQPITRGWKLHCVDALTGEGVWSLAGTGTIMAIADGYLVFSNSYDGCMYVIGKGPSSTTVEAPMTGITKGSSVVIRGTVMDVSPGTNDPAVALRFPYGVPAVSDESMSSWMEYVYMQKERPTDVKGVWVKLDAINVYTGEYTDIGGTLTDAAGFFTVAWTPPKEGLYTILATFPGSKSYWPSFAETSISVTAAPPASATADQVVQQSQALQELKDSQQASLQATQQMVTVLIIAVIIAIIIGVYNIYDHRKLKKQS